MATWPKGTVMHDEGQQAYFFDDLMTTYLQRRYPHLQQMIEDHAAGRWVPPAGIPEPLRAPAGPNLAAVFDPVSGSVK
jgi:hypothetical protein